MPINILMPALSPTMEKGNLAKWLKKEGDKVKSGDVIAEIETDKATMEVEAVDEGTIAKILVPEGTQDVPVNDIIAVLAGDGEDVKAAGAGAGGCAAPKRRRSAQAAAAAAAPAAAPAPKAAAAAPRSCRAAGGGCRCASQRPRPHLLVAAGPPSRQGSRHRTGAHQRLRPAWPRRRARRRGRQIRQGPEGAGRRARGGPVPSRRRCRTSRSSRCSRRAPTRSCRMTACAARSRSGSPRRCRPFRIST